MAKSKLEKLLDAITAAEKLRDKAEIGEGEGQFRQNSVDAFSIAIDTAKSVADLPDEEPSVYEEGTNVLLKEVDVFKAAQINSNVELPSSKTDPEKPESVVLPNWPEGKKGIHTIHLKERIFTFVDGKAELPSQLIDELKKAGYLE